MDEDEIKNQEWEEFEPDEEWKLYNGQDEELIPGLLSDCYFDDFGE